MPTLGYLFCLNRKAMPTLGYLFYLNKEAMPTLGYLRAIAHMYPQLECCIKHSDVFSTSTDDIENRVSCGGAVIQQVFYNEVVAYYRSVALTVYQV